MVVTRDRIRLCTLRSSSCRPGSGRLHAISCGRHCLTGCAPGQEAVDIRTYMEGLHTYAYHFLQRILLTSPVGYTSDTLAVKSVSTASEETYREAKMVPVSANSSSYIHTHTYIHTLTHTKQDKKNHIRSSNCARTITVVWNVRTSLRASTSAWSNGPHGIVPPMLKKCSRKKL